MGKRQEACCPIALFLPVLFFFLSLSLSLSQSLSGCFSLARDVSLSLSLSFALSLSVSLLSLTLSVCLCLSVSVPLYSLVRVGLFCWCQRCRFALSLSPVGTCSDVLLLVHPHSARLAGNLFETVIMSPIDLDSIRSGSRFPVTGRRRLPCFNSSHIQTPGTCLENSQ